MAELTLYAYCGMRVPIFTGDEKDLRWQAASLLKRRRKQHIPVNLIEKGREWEIECPEDAFMVPDWAGILKLTPGRDQDET